MFKFKGFSILVLWILMCSVDSKPIGICKTYFSIIGIEGDSLNGQALCSRTEIPFVYFVLKCNDSNSLKCAKNVQWSALSVCDKANVHHEEIPVTTALNTIDTSEFSMELSLFIQTEDEVRSVDEFIINTKVNPNDENLKTVVDSVGSLHKTQLEVEFHRVCSLPDRLRSPRQVISYLLRNHPKRRRKRAAATLEYADPGLSELQPSVSSNNGNPYLRDPFALSNADTDAGGGQINNVLPNQMQTTTELPYKQFWSKIANQFSKVNTTIDSDLAITIGLRNPYVTPAGTLTQYPGTSRSRTTLKELLLRDNKLSDAGNQDTFTVSSTLSSSSRATARFITRPAVTVPSTTPSSATSSTSSPTSTTPVATTPTTTTTNAPIPQTSSTTSTTTQPNTTRSTTTQPITTPSSTSTTTTTTSSPSTSSELPTTTSSIKPSTSASTSPTTEKQQVTTLTRVQSTSTSAATTSIPITSEQTTEMVMTKRPMLKPMVEDIIETTTTKEENSTENRISTEPSINTPLPSDETDTSASSSSSQMESTGTDTSGGDDSFWPIVAAMVIGIPSVIVFAIAITVIHKKRLGRAPRFLSSSMYPSL